MILCRSQDVVQFLTNKYHSDLSYIEKKHILLDRKTMFHGENIIIMTYNLNLCDNGKHLSNKNNLIKIRNFIEFEVNACDEMPKSVWVMDNLHTERISFLQTKQIFRVISDKIAFLICPEKPSFHLQDVNMQETRLFNAFK